MRSFSQPAVWLVCMTLIAGLVTDAVYAQSTSQIDSIVALVDDDVVLRSELDLAIAGIVDKIRKQGGDLPPKHLLEKQVLDRLILRRLELQRAFQTGIRISDADIDQSLLRLAQQNKLTLMQLRQVIEEDGEDFAELARDYSGDVSSANIGGDMGWFKPAAFGERIEQTIQAMEDGDISEPFQTPGGWHILERLGVREKDVTEESMRNTARNNLRQQKMDIEIERFLQQMRDEAFVEIKLPS